MGKHQLNTMFRRIILFAAFLIGGALFLYAAVPGGFSPFSAIQHIANALSGDGAFYLSVPIYRRLQGFAMWAGIILIALGTGSALAQRKGNLRVASILSFSLLGIYVLGIAVAANFLWARGDSLFYAHMVDTPPEPEPTAAPTAVATTSFQSESGATWKILAEGLDQPVAIVSAGDRTGRLFVVEKTGTIWILEDGERRPVPFLDLRDRLPVPTNFEQGLLGLAFHPQYSENGTFFVSYNDPQWNSVVSRFQVSNDPSQGDPNSEQKILGVFQPSHTHNGGTLKFGPDGYLYIGFGDGNALHKRFGSAQSVDSLYGSVLRIDIDRGNPYAIPADNPFANSAGRGEIWVYGLRNPWQFSFDPLTRDLYIGDVGNIQFEEINFLAADAPGGVNYGWSIKEGMVLVNEALGDIAPSKQLTDPIWTYAQEVPRKHCTVIGGQVYRGSAFPELEGIYLFGDFCSGMIWGLRQTSPGEWEHLTLFEIPAKITSFETDENDQLYLTDFLGFVWKLTP